MLDKLKKLSGSEEENTDTDPRWNVLKNIK